MDVHAYIAERLPSIDAAIDARMRARPEVPRVLTAAMRHLLFPGGKRLRPVLALAAAEAVAGDARAALPMAVAVELVHTYSLIHDDLPCMDDDALRRGRPTVHVAFDEATAVLAGDALLTEAFAALTEPGSGGRSGAPTVGSDDASGRTAGAETAATPTPESILQAVARLARAAGAAGLVGGQVDDLSFDADASSAAQSGPHGRTQADSERLASIHARKTAALFQAAVVGGATLAGADEAQRTALDAFALEVGTAFQIADDLLDADSEEATSILRVQAAGQAQSEAETLLDQALERIEGWGERAEPLRALARFAVRRDR
jgi:geranylgeranyl diphosphate synthase type II